MRIRNIFDPGSGIRDEHPGSYFRELRKKIFGLKIPKFCYADPDPGSGIFLTLDPLAGMEKLAPLFQDKQRNRNTAFMLGRTTQKKQNS